MKKLLAILLLGLGLTSCTMHKDAYTNQEIFYGETLIDGRSSDPLHEIQNTSFIYDPQNPDYCQECGIYK